MASNPYPRQPSDISIVSLAGGMNDTDPATQLPDDQCVLAENVEFYFSALGERRNGCVAMSLNGSGIETDSFSESAIVHLSQRFPTNDPNIGELWAVGATPGTSITIARRSNEDEWFEVTPTDTPSLTAPDIYRINAQPYLNKHFLAYNSAIDRLHVWDGTTLRRTGLAQPATAPTAINEGSGTYATLRYFRVRFIEKDVTGKVLRRSEPSLSLAFTPSGAGAGATITCPALIGEGETHWELEASGDNGTYYIIQTLPIATTTATDTTASIITYSTNNLTSEPIGFYLLQPSAKFLLVDGDRLIMAGHFNDTTKQSRIMWTPVSNDPGVGNDERLPLSTLVDDFIDLDNYEGGAITGLSQTANGSFYIFKWSHIYQATRTGNSTSAYDIICLSKVRGALPGSIVSGVDELGRACIYFLDPLAGPSRLGVSGLQLIRGLRRTWVRVNRLATGVVSHGVYYPEKHQMHWWVAADGSNFPSLKLVLQVNHSQENYQNLDVTRGWSLATGRIAEALCSAIVNVIILGPTGMITTIARRPYIGLDAPDLLQQCDLLSTDAGQAYVGKIITKPYIVAGLLNKWGAMTAALLADTSTDGALDISCVRDFGLETTKTTTDFTATAGETVVLRRFDNLVMSEAFSIQFQFSDPS